MELNVKIRAYRTKDKEELIKLLQENVPAYFAENEVEDYENYLEEDIQKYYVAEVDGQIVGAGGINFKRDNRIGKISWDFVRPDFQSKGIGSALLRHRLNLLDEMKSIESVVVRTSQLAFKFYEKNGFVLKQVHKDYWAPGYDMYKMVYSPTN